MQLIQDKDRFHRLFTNGNRTQRTAAQLRYTAKTRSQLGADHYRRASCPGAFLEESGAPMSYTPELIAELEILTLFNLANTQEGLKVHHVAAPKAIAAALRLHDKGLITQVDGGYLTSLGHEAATHAQGLLTILNVAETA